MIKMASARVENICFQDKIPVILTTYLELETYIKGHRAYKEIWTPELGERLNIPMEPDNRVDKFAVYVEKCQAVVGHLKKLVIWEVREDNFLLPQKWYLLQLLC